MSFNLSDYTDILMEFSSSIFSIILSSLFIGIVSLLAILLLMLLLRKTILIKRRHVILRILAISYFILIPIITGIWGFKWGLANNLQSELKKHVSNYTQELDAAFKAGMEISSDFITGSSIDNATDKVPYSANTAIDKFSNSIYDQYGKMLEQQELDKGSVSGKVANLVLRITKGDGISFAIKTGIKKLVEDKVGIDKNTTEKVMDVKFAEILNEGLFTKILTIQIDDFFTGIKKTILLTFCIILLLPIIEICIAFWMHKKNNPATIHIPS